MGKEKEKKAPKKGALKIEKRESIFNYDFEVNNPEEIRRKEKLTKKLSTTKQRENQDKYIGAKELPTINKKEIKKIKKRKQKENLKKQKELIKEEKKEAKTRSKIKKKLNVKQIKKIKLIRKITCLISISVISVTGLVLLILSPIFNIKSITVTGNNKLSKEEIINLLKIDEDTNIFKETNVKIKERLMKNAYINTIKIKRELPSNLKIEVTERNVEYMLEVGNSYAYIDKQGYILEISSQSISEKIKILGYGSSIENIKSGNRLCDEDLDKLNTIAQIIQIADNNDITKYITSINISDESNYSLYMESEKKTVYLGDNSNIDTKMLYVTAILEKEKGNEGEIFVNMDLNNKNPYFKEKV